MNEQELRLECLKMALAKVGANEVLKYAKELHGFLQCDIGITSRLDDLQAMNPENWPVPASGD